MSLGDVKMAEYNRVRWSETKFSKPWGGPITGDGNWEGVSQEKGVGEDIPHALGTHIYKRGP